MELPPQDQVWCCHTGKALLPSLAQQYAVWVKKAKFLFGDSKNRRAVKRTSAVTQQERVRSAVTCGSHPSATKNEDGCLSSEVTSFFPPVHILETVDYEITQ